MVLGRRTFNRIVEGAGRGPSYGPSPCRRMPRIWGHWVHLMTTVHRGRSSDGGFVAQFLPVRKFVSRLGFRHCFLGLFIFLGTLRLGGHSYNSERRLGRTHGAQSLQIKIHVETRQLRPHPYLGPNLPNDPQNLPACSIRGHMKAK